MLQTTEAPPYKSRGKVLLRFFRKSRDQWKQKCMNAKATLKKANNRSQWLATSRDKWKTRAKQLERELKELRKEQKAVGR